MSPASARCQRADGRHADPRRPRLCSQDHKADREGHTDLRVCPTARRRYLKLRETLASVVADDRDRAFLEPRLAHLIGLAERTAPDKEDLFSAWRLFFERLADAAPVVMVFEDLQWADAGLLDFIEFLLDWSRSYPLFLLVASQRPVALLVYLCPRLGSFPVSDEAPAVFREGFPFPAKDEEGRMVWQPSAAIKAMYPRLAPSTARELASRLRPGAFPKGDYPLTAPPDVPTALIYTTDDEFFRPEWERYAAHNLLGVDPIEMPGGHFPMQEHPDLLCQHLERLTTEHMGMPNLSGDLRERPS